MTGLDITNKIYDNYLEDKSFHYVEFAKREKKDIEVFRAHVSRFYNCQTTVVSMMS